MFTKVIAGWDGTPESQAAVEWAADHCGEAPLSLVHAIGGKPTGSEYLQAAGERSAERIELMEVADRLRATRPDLRVESEAVRGSAIDVLGERLAPDTLVVVGGPSHRRTTRWTIGSRLAGRRGGGLVAVIPETPATERRGAVVAGVDGSHASMAAVEIAAREADLLGAPLEVVHQQQERLGRREHRPHHGIEQPAALPALGQRWSRRACQLRTLGEQLGQHASELRAGLKVKPPQPAPQGTAPQQLGDRTVGQPAFRGVTARPGAGDPPARRPVQ